MEQVWQVVDAPEVSETKSTPASQWSQTLKFWLNGEEQIIENPSPSLFLVDWLREKKGLTGTKIGCHVGECGICTVAIAFGGANMTGEQHPVNSCLRKLCLLDGCHVTTTEGLGNQDKGYHAIQKAIADGNGSQCGYCTPGWVMSMYALTQSKAASNGTPTASEIEQHFDGNLCRCTGYRPILGAFGKFAEGEKHCGSCERMPLPAEMMSYVPAPLHFSDSTSGDEWYKPVSMDQLPDIQAAAKASSKRLAYICAGTGSYGQDEGANVVYADLTGIPDLQKVSFDAKTGLTCGSTVSIAQLIDGLKANAKALPAYTQMADHILRSSSSSIRSVGSWAGNAMMAKGGYYISDVVTSFVAAGVLATVLEPGATASKEVSTEELLGLGGVTPVAWGSLVLSMRAPPLPSTSKVYINKVMQRATHSDRIVTFSSYFNLGTDGSVTDARMLVGGTCDALLIPKTAVAAIVGKKLDDASFKAATAALLAEIRASPATDPLHTAAYREEVAVGFLYKAYLNSNKSLPENMASAIVPFIPAGARPISSGKESYGTIPAESPIGTYVPKLESRVQASGEATFPSDSAVGALFAQAVLSTSASATLQSLDPSEALKMPGVVAFVDASDIPGLNTIAFTLKSVEKVFYKVGDKVPCIGVQLGLVVAETWQQARAAAKSVTQVYAKSSAVTTMNEAITLGRIPSPADLSRADAILEDAGHRSRRGLKPNAVLQAAGRFAPAPRKTADKELKATWKTGGQRHWYMETQSVVATPVDGRWEFIISDQDPNYSATNLAAVLGVPMHQINCIQRRAGGGFGGKLSRQMPMAAACGIAARKLKKQIRAQNWREDDLKVCAGREPMDFVYDVSFDGTGKVDTMDLKINADVGWQLCDNAGDLAMAQGWSDNCYHYNAFKATPNALLTDTPATTSMRAPGCLQSLMAAEVVMEHIAKTVGKPTEEVMKLNWYKEGDATPFGDTIGKDGYNFTIPVLWEQIMKDADYDARKKAVADYNTKNRWTKKGIHISSVKYVAGISFYSSGAHICVYADGTVLVSHGGCEIGQGIHTKVALCVAETLGIPLEKVSVGTTETAKVPNNTCTGGSGTSECVSAAAILAAKEIAANLDDYRKAGKSWEDAITQANTDGVMLMASKWFKAAPTSNANQYATYGVAVSEVLVDVLTGEVRVERSDLVMDLGTQLDAAVDLGQVEGGFVMALGYLLTEQLMVDAKGNQLNTSTYKIPGAYDIPLQFNCSLLKDSPNPVGIKGSKLVAEPVMALTASAYLAIKEAIYAARQDAGLGDAWFMLNTPCTPEFIRAAIGTPNDKLVVPK